VPAPARKGRTPAGIVHQGVPVPFLAIGAARMEEYATWHLSMRPDVITGGEDRAGLVVGPLPRWVRLWVVPSVGFYHVRHSQNAPNQSKIEYGWVIGSRPSSVLIACCCSSVSH
jgi:hypothetical protein